LKHFSLFIGKKAEKRAFASQIYKDFREFRKIVCNLAAKNRKKPK